MEHKFVLTTEQESALVLLAQRNNLTAEEFIDQQVIGRFVGELTALADKCQQDNLSQAYEGLDPVKKAQVDAILAEDAQEAQESEEIIN